MKGRSGFAWLATVVVVGAFGLTACRDSGLPDRNLPLDQARHREYGYPAYEPAANTVPVAVAGRHWIRSLPVETIPARLLVSVSDADGTPVYALRGARPPYSRLYTPVGVDRWAPLLRLN